jgi:superfamily I DNA and/or RNA helicase
MILIGDAMQLQPVLSEAERRVARSTNGHPHSPRPLEGSLMSWLLEREFPAAATVLLDQQNRMHPAIGELVSEVFYGGRVTTGPAAPRERLPLEALPDPVTWIDTRSLADRGEQQAGTSYANRREAALVAHVVRYLAGALPGELSIGVIAMYAEQRELLRRTLGSERWPEGRPIEVATVDAFEGREQDVIVVSFVRANRRAKVGFLGVEQRLNVAVSRARRLLVLVGDTSTLRDGRLAALVEAVRASGRVVDAGDVVRAAREASAVAVSPN